MILHEEDRVDISSSRVNGLHFQIVYELFSSLNAR